MRMYGQAAVKEETTSTVEAAEEVATTTEDEEVFTSKEGVRGVEVTESTTTEQL